MIKKLSLFIVFKYLNFGIKAIKGLLIAKIMGPELFGVWAFLLMIEEYISYNNLGMPFILSIETANHFENKKLVSEYVNKCYSTYFHVAIVSLLLGMLFLLLPQPAVFEGYNLQNFIIILILHACLRNIQNLNASLFRVFNKFRLIIISEFILNIVPLSTIIFFEGQQLVFALLIAEIAALTFSFFLFFFYSPVKISLISLNKFDNSIAILVKDGLVLLIMNVAIYLFNLSSKTFVSVYYSKEEMGYFSFAVSITMASLLGIKSALWAIYPSIIKEIGKTSREKLPGLISNLEKVNSYIITNIVHLITLLSPFLFMIFPEYIHSRNIFLTLILAQGITSMGIGFRTFIMNKKKFIQLLVTNLIALAVTLLINYQLSRSQLDMVYLAHVIMTGYFLILVGMNFIYSKAIFGATVLSSLRRLDYMKVSQIFLLSLLLTIMDSQISVYLILASFILFNVLHFSDLRLLIRLFKSGRISN